MKLLLGQGPIDHMLDRIDEYEWCREDGVLVLVCKQGGRVVDRFAYLDEPQAWMRTGDAGEALIEFLETENGTRDCTD